jgi:hypothetical protein
MSRLPAIANPQRQPDPSDLSDAEWQVLEPFLPKAKGFGHPRTVDLHNLRCCPNVGLWNGVLAGSIDFSLADSAEICLMGIKSSIKRRSLFMRIDSVKI